MAPNKPPKSGAAPIAPTTKAAAGGAAAALAAALLIATPFISGWESGGKEYLTAYPDIVGVWTICDGETLGVKKGDRETSAGCKLRLDKRLSKDFGPVVLACTPSLKGKDPALAASISLAYNIGGSAYCKSTVDRRFDAGDIRGGCNAFLMWNKAGGKVVNGLTRRRTAERDLCLKSA